MKCLQLVFSSIFFVWKGFGNGNHIEVDRENVHTPKQLFTRVHIYLDFFSNKTGSTSNHQAELYDSNGWDNQNVRPRFWRLMENIVTPSPEIEFPTYKYLHIFTLCEYMNNIWYGRCISFNIFLIYLNLGLSLEFTQTLSFSLICWVIFFQWFARENQGADVRALDRANEVTPKIPPISNLSFESLQLILENVSELLIWPNHNISPT